MKKIKKKTLKFSVITVVKNDKFKISNTIKSVLNQTYKNFEIVIVDNNSNDDTLNLINSFKSDKIKIFNIVNNGNISKSINFVIKNLIGLWIAFLYSYDY